jgi:osmoprotectant transport system permease protein
MGTPLIAAFPTPLCRMNSIANSTVESKNDRLMHRRTPPTSPSPARLLQFAAMCVTLVIPACSKRSAVVVGSKAFTESVILGQIATDIIRAGGGDARHQRELGGTRLVWDALLKGEIDAYPEYTGTISNEILAGEQIHNRDQFRTALARRGISMTAPLGFDDSYALGMREEVARKLNITAVSQLSDHPELRLGFSNEFMDRADGWPALRRAYQLPQARVTGIAHDIAYRALAEGSIDVTDLYSTDAEIAYYQLRVLKDDLGHFPRYEAVFLYRTDLELRAPEAVAALHRLEGRIDQAQMIALNVQAKLKRIPETSVAADFLGQTMSVAGQPIAQGLWARLAQRTGEHVELVSVSLLAAILVAIPLGIMAASFPRTGQVIIGVIAGIYTIPSLALLVFMLPILGIGWKPAVAALFLYSLLPIVRNTHAGLIGLPAAVRESAMALGLPSAARLLRVELPLASPSILAGIQTSAVLNVGTATLGALIGAGGYGQPILTGIRLDNPGLILEGAVPAALMALLVQGAFELLGRAMIPRGMRAARQPE